LGGIIAREKWRLKDADKLCKSVKEQPGFWFKAMVGWVIF
jgi:hypothetical protein